MQMAYSNGAAAPIHPKMYQLEKLLHVFVFPFHLNHGAKGLRAHQSKIKSRRATSNPGAQVYSCASSRLPSALINNSHQTENERKQRAGGGQQKNVEPRENLRGRHEAKGNSENQDDCRGKNTEEIKMERRRQERLVEER